MSDTQDQLLLRQRHMQQRQILAMMGIEPWVQPDSPTVNVADIPSATVDQPVSSKLSGLSELGMERASCEPKESTPDTAPAIVDYNAVDAIVPHVPDEQSLVRENTVTESPATAEFDNHTINAPVASNAEVVTQTEVAQTDVTPTVEQLVAPLVESAKTSAKLNSTVENNNSDRLDGSLKKVAPFDLQGGRYGNWVLMVDIQALNNDSQKLWQNITQALSLSCETTSFPICEGMDTAELANASLAGYIFKIGRSEEVLVAALTELPDGLTHPNLSSVPTLDEMLADTRLKRDLWEQLSNQA
ncbi:hypothetical protein [Psychrobacter sp. LV10R520-6]|uniref:hypothetical protein n=1 Tax=Psychrobacter sp. LV10R520-6 TaxID=1415574 RepID=UPI0024C99207|nr:hypothetical protein [Psychrobacter sp. LV10R520-6]SNT70073.1 hypothetical protein SAMN04488491_1208 [Psychrobacter sp. LV10R520-6]